MLRKSHSFHSKIERKDCNSPSNTWIGPLKTGPRFSGVMNRSFVDLVQKERYILGGRSVKN